MPAQGRSLSCDTLQAYNRIMDKPRTRTSRRERAPIVSVRMSIEDVRTLDRYIAAQPNPKPSRAAVIRRILVKEIEEYRALEEIGMAKSEKLGS
jgi:hypothetical protein